MANAQIQQLEFTFAPIVRQLQDGSYIIKPGKPTLKKPDISINDAAKILGCSIWSVHRYIAEGIITNVRQVKRRARIRLNRAEIEALANHHHPHAV